MVKRGEDNPLGDAIKLAATRARTLRRQLETAGSQERLGLLCSLGEADLELARARKCARSVGREVLSGRRPSKADVVITDLGRRLREAERLLNEAVEFLSDDPPEDMDEWMDDAREWLGRDGPEPERADDDD